MGNGNTTKKLIGMIIGCLLVLVVLTSVESIELQEQLENFDVVLHAPIVAPTVAPLEEVVSEIPPNLSNSKVNISREDYIRAIYSFGDSTIDVGNNNYLPVNIFAKANYFPYGRDFDTNLPTGRFSNGRLVVDFVAKKLNFSEFPSAFYENVTRHILGPGVNFASSDSGILPLTGQEFGPVLGLAQQIRLFRDNTLVAIQHFFEYNPHFVASHMQKSLFCISTGSNDLLTDDALSRFLGRDSGNFTYEQMYTELWEQINELYLLGARKFVIIEIGAIGCTPNNMYNYNTTDAACYERLNDEVKVYNKNMAEFLSNRFGALPGATYIIAPTYDAIKDIVSSPQDFGFKYNAACCGGGPYGGMTICQFSPGPCDISDDYVWFDSFHPSQKTYSLVADQIWPLLDVFINT